MSASPRQRSLAALSLLCFALADVRDGLGPFFGVYLQGHGWTPDAIGYVMTLGGLTGVFAAAPAGALADATRHKRFWLAVIVCGGALQQCHTRCLLAFSRCVCCCATFPS